MTAPIPKTKASQIKAELDALMRKAGHHLDEADPRVIAWGDELATGTSAPRSEIFRVQAQLAELTGDIKHALRLLERAYTAGSSRDEVRTQKLGILCNLGYFSEAAQLCEGILTLKPPFGMPPPTIIAIAGAYKVLPHAIAVMENANMHSQLAALPQIHRLRQIAAGVQARGIPDAQYAAVLDIAGTVLRERKMFWLNFEPDMWFDPVMQSVCVRFHLDCAPSQARAMGDEFLDRLIANDLDGVPISVGFLGTRVDADNRGMEGACS